MDNLTEIQKALMGQLAKETNQRVCLLLMEALKSIAKARIEKSSRNIESL